MIKRPLKEYIIALLILAGMFGFGWNQNNAAGFDTTKWHSEIMHTADAPAYISDLYISCDVRTSNVDMYLTLVSHTCPDD